MDGYLCEDAYNSDGTWMVTWARARTTVIARGSLRSQEQRIDALLFINDLLTVRCFVSQVLNYNALYKQHVQGHKQLQLLNTT